jgi:hypothetical protein
MPARKWTARDAANSTRMINANLQREFIAYSTKVIACTTTTHIRLPFAKRCRLTLTLADADDREIQACMCQLTKQTVNVDEFKGKVAPIPKSTKITFDSPKGLRQIA